MKENSRNFSKSQSLYEAQAGNLDMFHVFTLGLHTLTEIGNFEAPSPHLMTSHSGEYPWSKSQIIYREGEVGIFPSPRASRELAQRKM